MLVLTRKLMERLYIGDDICVTIVRIEGGQVRIGIDAPRDVSVVRAELVPHRPAPRFHTPHQGHPLAARADLSAEPTRYVPFAARENDNRRRGRSR
jgi:carbon storage regulator